MMGWAIDDVLEPTASDHVGVVNEDTPAINENERDKEHRSLEGEDQNENVVRERLSEPIRKVEGMRCEWSGDDPLVMGLV